MTVAITIKESLSQAHGLLHMLGLDDHTYTHLSAKLEGTDTFLLTPFGLCFEEVTADSLLTVDFEGKLKEGSPHLVNQTGYVIHSALYKQLPHVHAVFHLHTPESVAVSVLKEGLMPLSQWALHFYDHVAYYDYDSLALDNQQGERLGKSLGQASVLFLRHHGIVTAGRTIHEAMFYAYHLQKACETQCKILAMKAEIIPLDTSVCKKTVKDLLSFEKDLGRRDWDAWVRRLERYRRLCGYSN